MTAFPSRFRLFRTVARLSLPLLTLVLLLPTEAASQPRGAADEQQTVEISNPRGTDAVAPSEITRVRQAADSSDQVKRARARAAGSPRPPKLKQLLQDVHPLYAQRHIEDKNAPQSRKADVYYYDYSTNDAYQVVVDLNSNAVQETHVTRGFRHAPFLTRAEINAGLQLIIDDSELGPKFLEIYKNLTGQSLTDVNQLNAEGGIFFPDSVAGTGLAALTEVDCQEDRCMQLFIHLDDEKFIDVSKIVVNLSKGKVLWVDEGITGHKH